MPGFGMGNLFSLLFRISTMENLLDKFKCWDLTFCFWGPVHWGGSCPGWGSGFAELMFHVTLLCPGCAAGPHPLHVEISFVISLMAINEEQLFKVCAYSIREIEFISQKNSG